ncbi:hypothetical protein C1I95_25830 [Micromonospora craterilacus]|uniref:Tyr recombinase domain-containing protein n=1 Tax=Micromonospora craterilacus TaxID=1655439 RepID=A0A2W2DQ78_9ACTN|nr:hypothetical protein C1I95_25830 [Micromonospora craterilacus]
MQGETPRRFDLSVSGQEAHQGRGADLEREQFVPAALAAVRRRRDAVRCASATGATQAGPGPRRKLRHDEVSTCGCPGILRRRPRLHDGRHTHATDLIRDGWEIHDVQRRLGHSSPMTTLTIYGHAWDGPKKKILDELAERRRKKLMLEDEAA